MTKRLFVSIDLPALIAQEFVKLDPHLRGVRWLPPEQMHLTISFLGSVSADAQEEFSRRLNAIAWSPFFLPLVGIGVFPAKGAPNVIWCGTGFGHPHLFQLHKRVQEAALGAGIEPDLRAWHPHVTLARCCNVSAEVVRQFLKTNATLDLGMIHVEAFALKSSRLTPAGSIYTTELEMRVPNDSR